MKYATAAALVRKYAAHFLESSHGGVPQFSGWINGHHLVGWGYDVQSVHLYPKNNSLHTSLLSTARAVAYALNRCHVLKCGNRVVKVEERYTPHARSVSRKLFIDVDDGGRRENGDPTFALVVSGCPTVAAMADDAIKTRECAGLLDWIEEHKKGQGEGYVLV